MKKTVLVILLTLFVGESSAQVIESRRDFREFEKSRFSRWQNYPYKTATANQQLFDVFSYYLDLDLDPDRKWLNGRVTIDGISLVSGLEHLEIDLYNHLTVDSVKQSGSDRSFTHDNQIISVNLEKPLNINEHFQLSIYYQGNPEEFRYRSFGWNNHATGNIIWTLSEPYGSPAWWPCKDDPKDKADSVLVEVTVPAGLIAVSNGILTYASETQNTTTYRWETGYPMSTYLVSLAISNYIQFSEWYHYSHNGSMELSYFVYPEHENQAREDLNITLDMLKFFASVFGQYPFVKEKYGMAIFPWAGGMEHQTITSYGAALIRGDHHFDYINAHELAHQWFGDCITMRSWSHIWLNEGFASYAEALWFESIYGTTFYHNYVNRWDDPPLNGAIFVVDSLNQSALFSRLVYDKGAWTLHMLRGVLGDSIFFESMRRYATDPRVAYGTATTEDFQLICEETANIDLSWFFEQWVYRGGRPKYEAQWSVSETPPYITTLQIRQTNDTLFTMPLELKISGEELDTSVVFWDSLAFQQFEIETDQKPDNLSIDPDNWVLKNVSLVRVEAPLPREFKVSQNFPNPFNNQTRVLLSLPDPALVTFDIFNILGEKVYAESAQYTNGYWTIIWNGTNNYGLAVASGLYIYRVSAGSQVIVKKMVLLR